MRLHPCFIIRYGAKIEGENEAISVYMKNDNFKACNDGW